MASAKSGVIDTAARQAKRDLGFFDELHQRVEDWCDGLDVVVRKHRSPPAVDDGRYTFDLFHPDRANDSLLNASTRSDDLRDDIPKNRFPANAKAPCPPLARATVGFTAAEIRSADFGRIFELAMKNAIAALLEFYRQDAAISRVREAKWLAEWKEEEAAA